MAEKTAQDIQLYDGTAWKSMNGQKVYDGSNWKDFQGVYDGADWWTLDDVILQWSGEVNSLKMFSGYNITMKSGHYLNIDMTYQWSSPLGDYNFPVTINSDNNVISLSINDDIADSFIAYAQNWGSRPSVRIQEIPVTGKLYRAELNIDVNGRILFTRNGKTATGISYASGFGGATMNKIFVGGSIVANFCSIIVHNLTIRYK